MEKIVKERRLRPIYELLDSSNNKRVVQEVDRLLKKQPNFTCAKVLKALGLLRMGKTSECVAIISPIVEEVPTDENIIQALTICYRELDQPHMVCHILEQACKSEKTEDLLSNCFMAYTRIGDFQKQHLTAMSLYKSYPKTPYFSWAIMSLYAKAERDSASDPSNLLALRVSLPLAERMMAKFVEDNKVESEHELTLYALILRKQQKYDKMLELLDNTFGILQLNDCSGFYNKYKKECLVKLNKHEELAQLLENNLKKNPDDYKSYAEYIRIFGETQTERVIDFLNEMRGQEKSDRSPLLAYLYLFQFLFDREIVPKDAQIADYRLNVNSNSVPKVTIDPIGIFKQYAEHFGNKPSFFMDLCGFLSGLQKDDAKDAFLAIMKDFIKIPIDYLNPNEIQRHINYMYMSRFFSNRKQTTDPLKIIGYVQNNVEKYLDGNEVHEEARKNSVKTDDIPQDEFIILACLMLVDSFWFDANCWKANVFTRITESKQQLMIDDLCPPSKDAKVKKPRTFLLSRYNDNSTLAAAPLSNIENDLDLLGSSAYNNQAASHDQNDKPHRRDSTKVNDTTVRNNHDSGDNNDQVDPIMGSTSKEKESLSNGLADKLSELDIGKGGQEYSLCEEDFPVLLNMALLEYAVERSPRSAQLRVLLSKSYIRCGAVGAGADAIIALDLKHIQWESLGYLYIWKLTSSGFYHEATRILKLAESFYTSYQKESMEFVISAYKYGSWEKILEFMDFRDLLLNAVQFGLLKIERQLLEYSKSATNRNQMIEVAQHSEIESLDLDIKFTDSRDFNVLLTYSEEKVSEDVVQKTFQADVRKLKVRGLAAKLLDKFVLSMIENNFSSHADEIEKLLSSFSSVVELDYAEFEINLIPVDGMWPPRIFQYKNNGHLDLLLNMFNLTLHICKDVNSVALSDLTEKVVRRSTGIAHELVKYWTASLHTLLNRADRLESLYEFIETLGFCCILVDVCFTLFKKNSSSNVKTKKKKAKAAGVDPEQQKNFNAVILAFLECLKQVDDAITSFPFASPQCFPANWNSVADSWGQVVNDDLKTYILPHSLPTVMRKLNMSYKRSLSDLVLSIKSKINYFKGISFDS